MFDDEHPERIQRVLAYIDAHLSDLDGARDVTEAVDVSYYTLRKQFRKEIGIPLGQYITQARINEAQRLLIETDDPVYVVCWNVGFSSDTVGIRFVVKMEDMLAEWGWRCDPDGSSVSTGEMPGNLENKFASRFRPNPDPRHATIITSATSNQK